MPRIKWTTNEQEEWLKDRCEAFKEAEEKDTRKSFLQTNLCRVANQVAESGARRHGVC